MCVKKETFFKLLKGSDHSEIFKLPCTKHQFLPDKAIKTMACYTFSFRPTIPDSENLKISMKKINEEENEDFCEEEYFNFGELSFGEEKIF